MYIKSKRGIKVGTLIDDCSTDHYMLNSSAKKMRLKGIPVDLLMEGFEGNETTAYTHEYQVPVVDKNGSYYKR